MTTRKRTDAAKGKVKKLKLKKETLKDLDVKNGKGIRGGILRLTGGCQIGAATPACVTNAGQYTCFSYCGVTCGCNL